MYPPNHIEIANVTVTLFIILAFRSQKWKHCPHGKFCSISNHYLLL